MLCQKRDINNMSRGNAKAPNRHNSWPYTVRTWLVGCLQKLGSRAFAPTKRSGSMFLSQPSPEVFIV